MELLRGVALFRRFPKFQPLPREKQYLISPDEQQKYSEFREDFETLERELMLHFRELDNEAMQGQNGYRWTYIILIFGGAIVTILGIVQIAFQVPAIALAAAIVAVILGAATTVASRFNHQARYLNARLAAERLRSEYFLFVGHMGEYASEQDRVQNLIRRVADFKRKGEPDESA